VLGDQSNQVRIIVGSAATGIQDAKAAIEAAASAWGRPIHPGDAHHRTTSMCLLGCPLSVSLPG
jgi:hypothetical protein